jgi:hypothetical protein
MVLRSGRLFDCTFQKLPIETARTTGQFQGEWAALRQPSLLHFFALGINRGNCFFPPPEPFGMKTMHGQKPL